MATDPYAKFISQGLNVPELTVSQPQVADPYAKFVAQPTPVAPEAQPEAASAPVSGFQSRQERLGRREQQRAARRENKRDYSLAKDLSISAKEVPRELAHAVPETMFDIGTAATQVAADIEGVKGAAQRRKIDQYETEQMWRKYDEYRKTPEGVAEIQRLKAMGFGDDYIQDLLTEKFRPNYLESMGMDRLHSEKESERITAIAQGNAAYIEERRSKRAQERAEKYPEYFDPNLKMWDQPSWSRAAVGAAPSVPGMVLAVINPILGSAYMTAQESAPNYTEMRGKGFSAGEAAAYTGLHAIGTFALEKAPFDIKIPTSKLAKAIGGPAAVGLAIAAGAAKEGGSEWLQEGWQYATSHGFTGTFEEFVAETDHLQVFASAGLMGAGVQTFQEAVKGAGDTIIPSVQRRALIRQSAEALAETYGIDPKDAKFIINESRKQETPEEQDRVFNRLFADARAGEEVRSRSYKRTVRNADGTTSEETVLPIDPELSGESVQGEEDTSQSEQPEATVVSQVGGWNLEIDPATDEYVLRNPETGEEAIRSDVASDARTFAEENPLTTEDVTAQEATAQEATAQEAPAAPAAPEPIMTKRGVPFVRKGDALVAARRNGLDREHVVELPEGGFVVQPPAPEAQTETPAAGETEVPIQRPVDLTTGQELEPADVENRPVDQRPVAEPATPQIAEPQLDQGRDARPDQPMEASANLTIEKQIKKLLPWGRVTRMENDNGWTVALPTGAKIDFFLETNMPIDPLRLLQTGQAKTPEQAEYIARTGRVAGLTTGQGTTITLKDGKVITANEVTVLLDPKNINNTTVRHELLHVARQLGMFNTKEGRIIWEALESEYGGANDSNTEENIAKAREKWTGKKGLWARINDFINRIFGMRGKIPLNVDNAMRATFGKKFWNGASRSQTGTETMYQVVSPQQDSAYMSAVEAGDMETAQQMVDRAAKAAGYVGPWWHGGKIRSSGATVANIPSQGFFLARNKDIADSYNSGGQTDPYFFRHQNAFDPENPRHLGADWVTEWIDFWATEDGWVDRVSGEEMSTSDVLDMISRVELYNYESDGSGERWRDFLGTLREHHDGFRAYDPTDLSWISVVFDPNQIKSADPVTYDDQGNVVPLSERFNEQSPDIRYQIAPNLDMSSGDTASAKHLFRVATHPDNQYGFTIARDGNYRKTGVVVAPLKSTEQAYSPAAFTPKVAAQWQKKHAKLLSTPGVHVGGWLDEKTTKYVLDASVPLPSELDAIKVGIWADQDAVYNIDTETEIPLKNKSKTKQVVPPGVGLTLEQIKAERPADVLQWTLDRYVPEGGGQMYQLSSLATDRLDAPANLPVQLSTSVGTRVQGGRKVAANDPTRHDRFPTLELAQSYPTYFEKMTSMIATGRKRRGDIADSSYDFMGGEDRRRTPTYIAEKFIDFNVTNLLHLHDAMDAAIRRRSRLWYDGARKLAEVWSHRYGLRVESVAGIIASQSPQKDWFTNLSMAERLMDIWQNRGALGWSAEMEATAERIYTSDDQLILLETIRGKDFASMDGPFEQAAWARVYDEAHNDKRFKVVTPEGGILDYKTEGTKVVQWSGNNTIAKAFQILNNPDDNTVLSAAIGGAHKVRNFYNNIVAPWSQRGEVTIDTHAVTAGIYIPLGGTGVEVIHNLAGPPKVGPGGLIGTYPLYAEAYGRAASQRNLLPRELQSITWEAVRTLFQNKSANNVAFARKTWQDFSTGKITHEQALAAIEKNHGGLGLPDWVGSDIGLDASEGHSTYTGPLVAPSVSQQGLETRTPRGRGIESDSGQVSEGSGEAGTDQHPNYQIASQPPHIDRLLDKWTNSEGGANVLTFRELRGVEIPTETTKVYKLVELKAGKPGYADSLFDRGKDGVGKKSFPFGKWIRAEEGMPVISGPLAFRPGFHAVGLPVFDQGKVNAKGRNRVWAEVEIPAFSEKAQRESDNSKVLKNGMREGITTRLIGPKESYNYKTNPNASSDAGSWPISGSMKMIRLLTNTEVNRILSDAGLPEKMVPSNFNDETVAALNEIVGAAAPSYQIADEQRQARVGLAFKQFFSDVTKGTFGKSEIPFVPNLDLTGSEPVIEAMMRHSGNFSDHIFKSIPTFFEAQVGTAQAVSRLPAGKVLDIAGSEGTWGKTVTELSGGKVQTVNLDPNLDMKATFEKTSTVDGATFAEDAFLNGFKDGDRDVKAFDTKERFDVIHESMGFQFIDNNRRDQVDEVKRLMKPDGVFLTEQKLLNEDWEANEEYKNVNHKDKYFTAEELAQKDTRVGYSQSLAESEAVGMVDNMVTLDDYRTLLENTFEYVEMYWDSGNFKGFAASDSQENLRKVTGGIPDLTSEFSTDQGSGQQMYQIADSEYMSAVEAGDMETAQRMVDRAAKVAGYRTKAYHATDRDITSFKNPEIGFHFAEDAPLARNAAIKSGKRNPSPIAVALKLDNPLVVKDAPKNGWVTHRTLDKLIEADLISQDEYDEAMEAYEELEDEFDFSASTEEEWKIASGKIVSDLLRVKGYDSIKYWNTFDAGLNTEGTGQDVAPNWSYIALDPTQIKSADPVVRDDQGNVVPPSKRFNVKSPDIRYQIAQPQLDKYAQPEGFLDVGADGKLLVTHWSFKPTLKRTSPAKNGTGGQGREGRRAADYPELWVNRTYFGFGPYKKEDVTGGSRYGATINPASLYDFVNDPLGLYPTPEELEEAGYAPFDEPAGLSIYERKIKKAGFAGMASENGTGQLFYPIDLTKVEAGDETLTEADIPSGPMYQIAGTFYSPLAKAVEEMKQETFRPAQLKGALQKLPGIKGEEIDDLGFFDWLDGIDGKVTKAEVLAFVENAGPKIEEVTKGGDAQEAEIDAFLEDELGEGMDRDEAREYLGFDEDSVTTKYEGYQLPGGENYREVLLTLPPKADPTFSELVDKGMSEEEARDVIQAREFESESENNYKSSHWDEKNILAHVRLNDRTEIRPNPEHVPAFKLDLNFDDAFELIDTGTHYKVRNKINGKEYVNSYKKDLGEERTKTELMKTELRREHPGIKQTKPASLYEKILFVEEIQSDWHQEGRKKGYKADKLPAFDYNHPEITKAEAEVLRLYGIFNEWQTADGDDEYNRLEGAVRNAVSHLNRVSHEVGGLTGDLGIGYSLGEFQVKRVTPRSGSVILGIGGTLAEAYDSIELDGIISYNGTEKKVPNAPFKKSWSMLAFKRILRMAAEGGYDSVGWTPGGVQAERYDLSKQVDSVTVNKRPGADRYDVQAWRDGRNVLGDNGSNVDSEGIADLVGKDVAEKALQNIEEAKKEGSVLSSTLSGLDLKVGGSGMKGFYDQILPKEVGKYIKKLDKKAKVETATITGDEKMEVWSLPITETMKSQIMGGQPMYQIAFGDFDFSVTSIKKDTVFDLRDMMGRDQLPGVDPETHEMWLEEAAAMITADEWSSAAFLNDLKGDPRELGPQDVATLQMIHRAAYNKYKELSDLKFEAYDRGDSTMSAHWQHELKAQLKWIDHIEETKATLGTYAGRTLNAFKIALAEDFTPTGLYRKARVKQNGAPLKKWQEDELDAFSEKLQKLQADLEAEQLKNSDLQKKVDELLKAEVKRKREAGKPKAHTVKARAQTKKKQALNNFKAVWEKNGFTFFDNGAAPDEGTSAYQVDGAEGGAAQGPNFNRAEMQVAARQMADAFLEAGAKSFGEFWVQVSPHMGAQAASVKEIFEDAWDAAADGDIGPVLNTKADITKEARRIQRALVEEGFTSRNQIVALVQEAMSDVLPDQRAAMEALSGYGQFSLPSQEETAKLLRAHNAQLLKLVQMDRLKKAKARVEQLMAEGKTGDEIRDILTEEDLMPKATGPQRDEPDDIVRKIQRRINELKRSIPISPEARAGQLKSAMDTTKKVLGNRIKDLKAALESGQPIAGKGPRKTLDDAEIIQMREELALLTKEYREMFPPARRPLTEEQRIAMREKALDRAIAELERQLAEDDLGPRPKKESATSPVIKVKEAQLAELRQQKKNELEARNPKMTPEERARRNYELNLKRRIAEYQEILKSGDFTPKPKKEKRVLSRREINLKRKLERTRHEVWEKMEEYRIKNGGPLVKVGYYTKETAHLSRAVMTSIDVSAVLRQGAMVTYAHPKLAKRAATEMAKAALSEESEFRSIEEMRDDPLFQFAERVGLSITSDTGSAIRQEEAYMGRWAKKVPLVAGSGRAYTTYINQMRFLLFKQMVDKLAVGGQVSVDEGKVIAKYINAATGRADLKALNQWAANLNGVFFAPRWVASRFQYLGMPVWVLGSRNISPRVKKAILREYLQTSLGMATVITSMLIAAHILSDDDDEVSLEINPLATDFMRVKIGDTRMDPTGSMAPTIVFASRMLAGRSKTQSGKIKRFGEGYKPDTRLSTGLKWLRYKLAPMPGAAVTWANDMTDPVGQKVTYPELVSSLFFPLSTREVVQTARAQNIPTGAMLNILAIFGMGVSTYGEKTEYQGGILDWLTGNEERRKELFQKKLKTIQWDDPPVGYASQLTPGQLQQLENARLRNAGFRAYQLTNAYGNTQEEKEAQQKALQALRGYNRDLEVALEYYMQDTNRKVSSSRRRRLRELSRQIER